MRGEEVEGVSGEVVEGVRSEGEAGPGEGAGAWEKCDCGGVAMSGGGCDIREGICRGVK